MKIAIDERAGTSDIEVTIVCGKTDRQVLDIVARLRIIFFTPAVIKRMAYPTRLAIFGICLYAVLAAVAATMSWFPIDLAGAWISFTVIYLVMLAGASAFFHFKAKRE